MRYSWFDNCHYVYYARILKNYIFLFHCYYYYIHYSVILTKKILFWLSALLFFYYIHVFYYLHHVMIKMILFSFLYYVSALRSMRHSYRKRNLIFIEPLLWLCYDHEKNVLFLFHWDVHRGNIFLHHLTLLTTSLTCRKNSQMVYSPEKTCVTFFLRTFSGVLHESYIPKFLRKKVFKSQIFFSGSISFGNFFDRLVMYWA